MKPSELTPRQGKVLRYVVSRDRHAKEVVEASQVIVQTKWSDLPHTLMQAQYTLRRLAVLGLIERSGRGYVPTEAGIKLIAAADKKGRWKKPPPPTVTNQPRRTA